MRKLALAVMALALTIPLGAVAKDTAQDAASGDPMAAWKPPRIMHEKQDKKEIGALFSAMHQASVKGDLDAAAALMDFPVLMVTDDSSGQAMGETWDREKWLEVMKPFYSPHHEMKVKHKPTITLLTDSLATIADEATITMGKKTVKARSSMLAVRKDDKWLVKSMVEGGWGDMMKEKPATASQPMAPSGTGSGMGSGSHSGMGSGGMGSGGMGSGMESHPSGATSPSTGAGTGAPSGMGTGTKATPEKTGR